VKISVIIPIYNEASVIDACLQSLSKQTYRDLEIIVVDDGSTDGTLSNIRGVKLLKQEHEGPGAARNLGVKESLGEIIVFVDADMVFKEDFIEKLIKPITGGVTKGTFSKDEYVSNWNSVWARCWSEFERVGGFDVTRGYNDDWSLSEKLGYKADVVERPSFTTKTLII